MKAFALLTTPINVPKWVRRTVAVLAIAVPLFILGSCVWELWPRSWSTRETAPEIISRVEKTYQIRFPTNSQIVECNAWIQHVPRASDKRYTALQFVHDRSSGEIGEENLGTNFMDLGQGSTPQAYAWEDHAPWMTIVSSQWEHFYADIKTLDNDAWRRIHKVSIYVEPATNSTKRKVVFFGFDVRSERND